MTRNVRTLFLVSVLSVLIITCKKTTVDQPAQQEAEQQVDLSSKVTASVSGFVTNESGTAVQAANVQYGLSTTTTDKYGYFEIKNATVTAKAAFVTVSINGYFKGIKTFTAQEGKENFCRIKLIPKTNAGTVNAGSGGDVTLGNGLNISIPANGIMNAATNAAYNGTVHVASSWIDPTSNDLESIMPGDLRGINGDNFMRTLTSYGMAAVELTGDAGELLQIATGKKATLTIPIPSAILGNASASIPLWYFDESIGLWKEEGTATKSGNNYTGEVAHFSFWNCDDPSIMSFVDFTIVDANGNPLNQVSVKISPVSDPVDYRVAYTNGNGYASGYIPKDEQFLLEVINESCVVFSMPFNSIGLDNIQLGNIAVPQTMSTSLSGSVVDCNNQPVTAGRIIMEYNGQYALYPINNDGTFSFSKIICEDTTTALFIAEDLAAFRQSAPVFLNLYSGETTNHNFPTCDALIGEFFSYTIDGTHHFYEAPSSVLYGLYDIFGSNLLRVGVQGATPPTIWIHDTNPGVAGDRLLESFADIYLGTNNTALSPIIVHLTQYGQEGELIQGYFEGDFHATGPDADHHVTCSFSVKRIP